MRSRKWQPLGLNGLRKKRKKINARASHARTHATTEISIFFFRFWATLVSTGQFILARIKYSSAWIIIIKKTNYKKRYPIVLLRLHEVARTHFTALALLYCARCVLRLKECCEYILKCKKVCITQVRQEVAAS